MDRHQRCLNTIANRPTDHAPAYMPAIACEVASRILGRKAHTGTGSLRYAEVLAWSYGEQAHAEFEQQMYQDLVDLQRALDIDVFRQPWRMNVRPTLRVDQYTFVFGDPKANHSVWQYNPASTDFDEIRRVGPVLEPEEAVRQQVAAMENQQANRTANARAGAEKHRQLVERFGKEFFVVSTAGGISVNHDETHLMALALVPELMTRLLMLQAEDAAAFGQALAALPSVPQVMLGGGDMAGTNGLMFSPEVFRQVVTPAYQYAISRLNALGIHYGFRSDGNLWSVADQLFKDAAVPGYGETDRDATMTVGELRKRFPNLVFWGNFSSSFLAQHNAHEVKEEAKRIIDESQGRGYFQACSNAIMIGTPPENVEALFSVR